MAKMDPKENLQEQHKIANRILSGEDDYFKQAQFNEDARQLARLVQALAIMEGVRGGVQKVTIEVTEEEFLEIREALDSHVYWQLSEAYYRVEGFVNPPGSDDPEMQKRIKLVQELHDRLERTK